MSQWNEERPQRSSDIMRVCGTATTRAAANADRIIALAGDMWNELENLRHLWMSTDCQAQCEDLIARYESLVLAPRTSGGES